MDLERSGDVAVGSALTDARDLERPQTEHVVVETEGGIDFDPTFAGFGARFAGYVIDSLIVMLAMTPGVALALTGSTGAIMLGAAVSFIGFLVVTLVAARSIAASGKFVGNRVSGTSIVDTRTGRLLDTSSAAARFALRHSVSSFFFVGFLPAFTDSQRRTFHDRVATSIVVTRPREVWTADEDSPGRSAASIS